MSVLRRVVDGPLAGRRLASPPDATRMATAQAVAYFGGGRSAVVGPLLHHLTPGGEWVHRPWTPVDRLAVPESYDTHFWRHQ